MFSLLSNLAKAAVAVAIAPVDLVADVLTIPASATNDEPVFGRTAHRLGQVGDAVDAALKPHD